jgi:ubiquinone/menaquinone biosynthesis C-methylase UbiE
MPAHDPPAADPPAGSPESPGQVAAAYDGIAAGYDRLVAEDGWMRERLWEHYLRVFRPGDRILDVACGTGLDTLHLAAHGRRVTGVDLSPGMVEELLRKAARQDLGGRLEAHVGDAAALDGLADREGWPAGAFDGIVSSFAGLNTADLPRFAATAARLVRPHGRVVLHLLAPAGIWERLRLALRGHPLRARRLAQRRELTVTISGRAVRHALLPAAELYRRHFAAAFALRRRYGLGWLWPRRLGGRFGRLRPAALRSVAGWLGRFDAAAGRFPPCRGWGRFYVLDLERRPEGPPADAPG